MMDKYSVFLHPKVRKLQADPVVAKSPLWQYVYAVTPYILTIAVSGIPPVSQPKFHSAPSGAPPKLSKPAPVDVFQIQEAYKQCGRVGVEVLEAAGSDADHLGIVVWCRFLPSGKSRKPLLEVRAVVDKSGIYILELFIICH